jgi:protein involved in polysaccharide export with SLBB domain
VYVRTTAGFQQPKTVTIKGEVKFAGEYVIDKKEMRISDLLARAGGITKYAYIKGVTLVRKTKNYKPKTTAELQNETLNSLKDNLQKDGVLVSSEKNREYIRRIDNKILENLQTINDEKELKEKETQKQSLLKDNAALKGKNTVAQEEKEQELVAIDFDAILKAPGSIADILLKDGDELEVPEQLETVSVKGGVLYPVSVRYEPGLNFNEYINRSGGYVPQAMRNRSYVLQANGKVERVKHFLFFKSYPKVEPGAQVFVPIDTSEKPPFTYEKGLGIITSALTLIFLLRTL